VKFRLLQPAVQELRVAAKYYNDRVPGLGSDFLHEVRESIRRILNHPEAWVALDKNILRCRTHRFPYGIIYSIERDEILIISIMNLQRHPESWRQNLH
jgi:ParE toxin of type II toxin-antitoxin system, parDE